MKNNRSSLLEIVWFVVILTLFIVSLKMVRSGNLAQMLSSFGILAPIILVILKALTLIIAPLGGSPLYFLSGAMFGNLQGFLLCFLGDALGSAGCFFISRKFGDKIVRKLAGDKFFVQIKKYANLLGDTKSFVKARIAVFNIPELSAYAAGLSPISFLKFILVQMLFSIPVSFLLVFFGYQIANLSLKYFFLYPLILSFFAFGGFVALYKDYESSEEFLKDEKTKEI